MLDVEGPLSYRNSRSEWWSMTHLNVFGGIPREARQTRGSSTSWCYIVLAHRDRRWWKRRSRSSSRRKARYFFRWQCERIARARRVTLRAPGWESSRWKLDQVLGPGLNLPFFLPSFRFGAMHFTGALPVALACTDHHQMAFGNLTRPRATPLRPRKPRHRYLARVTLASEGFKPRNIYDRDRKAFLTLRLLSYDI